MKIVLLILFAAYAAVCALAWARQRTLVYAPSREITRTPADAGLRYDNVTFHTRSGRALQGWMVPTRGAVFTVLYCHGNAGNISDRVEEIERLCARGLSVFMFDYAGYGRSAGTPSESRTYEDARAAWDFLVCDRGVSPERIIVLGRSLGTAVAVELVTRVTPAALVLISPFTSGVDMGARRYPWLPVRLLARYRYDTASRIGVVRVPKLFVHSIDDAVVPYGMGRRLYARAPHPKRWVRVHGPHGAVYLNPGSTYDLALRELLDELERRVRPYPRGA